MYAYVSGVCTFGVRAGLTEDAGLLGLSVGELTLVRCTFVTQVHSNPNVCLMKDNPILDSYSQSRGLLWKDLGTQNDYTVYEKKTNK